MKIMNKILLTLLKKYHTTFSSFTSELFSWKLGRRKWRTGRAFPPNLKTFERFLGRRYVRGLVLVYLKGNRSKKLYKKKSKITHFYFVSLYILIFYLFLIFSRIQRTRIYEKTQILTKVCKPCKLVQYQNLNLYPWYILRTTYGCVD